jgi:hypothetical protein
VVGAYSKHERQEILIKNLRIRDHMEDLAQIGRMILK